MQEDTQEHGQPGEMPLSVPDGVIQRFRENPPLFPENTTNNPLFPFALDTSHDSQQRYNNAAIQDRLLTRIRGDNVEEGFTPFEMPGVTRLVEQGYISPDQAQSIKNRMEIILTLQALLENPTLLNSHPGRKEDVEFQLRRVLLGIANEPADSNEIYSLINMPESSNDFRSVLRKVFALHIQYAAQGVLSDPLQNKYPKPSDELKLTPFQASLFETEFPENSNNTFLARSAKRLDSFSDTNELFPPDPYELLENQRLKLRALTTVLGRNFEEVGEVAFWLGLALPPLFSEEMTIEDAEAAYGIEAIEESKDLSKEKNFLRQFSAEMRRPVSSNPESKLLELAMLNVDENSVQAYIDDVDSEDDDDSDN